MNGLAQITIDGQSVVLKFGLPALRQIVRSYTTTEMLVGDEYSELGITHILFAGYENGCAMENKVSAIPFKKFYEYVEQVDDEAVKQEIIGAMRAFEESKAVRDHLAKKKMPEATSPSTSTQ